MEKYNRLEHLDKLHKKRKEDTLKKLDNTIDTMLKRKDKVNFNSVSNESGISKATIYNNPAIRERIETIRQQQMQLPTQRQQKIEMSEKSKDALIESLRRKIKNLEEDNKKLNEQLKRCYGKIYKNI